MIVSVKGGATKPPHVRDLLGTVESQRAEVGVMVTMAPPTARMTEAANHSGRWNHPANGQPFPKVQIISVPEIIAGKRPDLPMIINPFTAARRQGADNADEGPF